MWWYAYGRIVEALFYQLNALMNALIQPVSLGQSEVLFFREGAYGREWYAPDLLGWRRAGQSICIIWRLMRLPLDADWCRLVTDHAADRAELHWPIRLVNRQKKE